MIITTHSMEEAEVLCGRIGIVSGGRLRCLGTQLRLKNRFGDGYKLTLSLANGKPETMAAARAFVATQLCAGAKEVAAAGTSATLTCMLPREGVDVASLFQLLEQHKSGVGIREWGVTQTSLEEVFVKVVEQAEDADQREQDKISAATGVAGGAAGAGRHVV